MKPLGRAAAETEARARHSQWSWCRRPNGFSDKPMWRLVAEQLGMPAYQVIAFVNRLEELANDAGNRGYARGEVGHFNPNEFGLALGMSAEEAARIFVALEQVGWIAFDHVADFYDRNKDREDPGAALRQRRKYARDKIFKMLAKLAAQGLVDAAHRTEIEVSLSLIHDERLFALNAEIDRALSTGAFLTREERRESVRLTPEKSTGFEVRPVDNSGDAARGEAAGLSAEEVSSSENDPQAAARQWIALEGRRIVIDRMPAEHPGRIDTLLERWRDQDLNGDAVALMTAIIECSRIRSDSASFHIAMTSACSRHRRAAAAKQDGQGKLPLGGLRPVDKRTA